VVLPLALLLLTSMMEFGLAFHHDLTLEYATREGARIGTVLGNGSGTVACGQVDAEIVAAVERVISAPGSIVVLANVPTITIWKSTSTGDPEPGFVNTWTYVGPNAGPAVNGGRISFTETSQGWSACSRTSGPPADSIGVALKYTYHMVGPMAALLRFFGGSSATTLQMSDETIMAINPST
jgi:hypothetical protein